MADSTDVESVEWWKGKIIVESCKMKPVIRPAPYVIKVLKVGEHSECVVNLLDEGSNEESMVVEEGVQYQDEIVEEVAEKYQDEIVEEEAEKYQEEMVEARDAEETKTLNKKLTTSGRKRKPKKSGIWAHFTINDTDATCKYCNMLYKCGSNLSTSPLFRHMRARHPEEVKGTKPIKCTAKIGHSKKVVKAEQCEDENLEKEDEPSHDENFESEGVADEFRVTKKGKIRKQVPRRSGIWHHFKLAGKQAKCTHCDHFVQCGSNQSTSALFRHMRAKHEAHASEIVPSRVVIRKQEAQKKDKYEPHETKCVGSVPLPNSLPMGRPPSNHLQTINERVIFLLAREYFPLDLVENNAFSGLLTAANIRCDVPSKLMLKEKLIPEKCFTITREIQRKLHHVHALCLTADGWTSRNCENYISITAHWINPEDFERNSALLSCTCYEEPDSPEILKNIIQAELERWKITNKVMCIVSDGASNIKAAIERGRWSYVESFAHALVAAVDCATTHIVDVVGKIKKIVTFFNRCSVAEKTLMEVQRENNLPEQKLYQSCPIRWKSIYKMLSRFSEMRECVTATLQSLTVPDVPPMPSDEEWMVIEQSCQHLRPVFEIIREMEAENFVLLSKVIPYVSILTETVDQAIACETFHYAPQEIQNLLLTLKAELVSRFAYIENGELLAEATLLDPRFKEHAFQDPIKSEVGITRLRRKFGITRTKITPVKVQETNEVWERFDQKLKQLEPKKKSSQSKGCMDLEKYLSEKYLDRRGNPLKWWLRKKTTYPKLAEFALERLCVQAAAVPCQDMFSRSGLIRAESRSCLKPDMLCELVFLNYNL